MRKIETPPILSVKSNLNKIMIEGPFEGLERVYSGRGDESESFLDSPDFLAEIDDEKGFATPNILTKRGTIDKKLKVVTQKAFSEHKDSSSSDSETKLFAKKVMELDKKESKTSKFKPPVSPRQDIENVATYSFLETNFQSQKDVEKMERNEEEKSARMKLKEAKLKETYYVFKLYTIILKTSLIFEKNSVDTKVLLKIKETLKELEKYEARVKNKSQVLESLNDYKNFLTDYLNTYNILQIVLREMDQAEIKDFSAASKKYQDKICHPHHHHYESDSNDNFLGTPPRKWKSKDYGGKNSPLMELEKLESMKQKLSENNPDSNRLDYVDRTFSFQEKPQIPLAITSQLSGSVFLIKNQSENCIRSTLPETTPVRSSKFPRQFATDLRQRKRQTLIPCTNFTPNDILSPHDLPKSKKKMDSSANLSLRRKLREKTKKVFSGQNLFSFKNALPLQKNESMCTQKTKKHEGGKMEGFDEVLNEEEEFLIDHFMGSHPGYYSDSYLTPKTGHPILENQDNSLSIKDFECIRLINKGAFGRVWLVKRKSTNDLYAMKIVNILDHIIHKKDTKFLEAECKIYDVISGEFVVKALFQFTHETFLCFVTEYMIGGDLGFLLHQYKCLDERVARFYIAELILAIDSLHAANIIHRDLKPDNILLDAKGHLKLTDFGLSKLGIAKKTQEINSPNNPNEEFNLKLKPAIKFLENENFTMKHRQTSSSQCLNDEPEKTHKSSKILTPLREKISTHSQQNFSRKHRAVGTPDYMAPEILNGSDDWMNSPSVDWWALGVMIFEFIVGIPPFNDSDWKQIFENILTMSIPWDQLSIGRGEDSMSEEAADLIKKMLVLNPEDRITKNGSAELKNHKFFEGMDWENLREQTAPIIPSRDLENPLEKDNRKIFSEIEKNDPFFSVFDAIRESDENLKKAKKKAHELLPTPKENLKALNEKNKQLAKEVNQSKDSQSEQLNSPLFDEYPKQRMKLRKI